MPACLSWTGHTSTRASALPPGLAPGLPSPSPTSPRGGGKVGGGGGGGGCWGAPFPCSALAALRHTSPTARPLALLPPTQVQQVYHGHSPHIEGLLGCAGPFWGRQYFFWHNGAPLTLIYEVFSPQQLQPYLGQLEPGPAHSASSSQG